MWYRLSSGDSGVWSLRFRPLAFPRRRGLLGAEGGVHKGNRADLLVICGAGERTSSTRLRGVRLDDAGPLLSTDQSCFIRCKLETIQASLWGTTPLPHPPLRLHKNTALFLSQDLHSPKQASLPDYGRRGMVEGGRKRG